MPGVNTVFRRPQQTFTPGASAPAGVGNAIASDDPPRGSIIAFPDFSGARGELGDALDGRITLAVLDAAILALVLFYYVTQKRQGGG